MEAFPPTHPETRGRWMGIGWFAAQYKWSDRNRVQHTSDKYPSVPCGTKVYGPYVTFCYYQPGKTDKRKYLGLPSSVKYRKFVQHWKLCSTVEEAREFFEKK